MQCFYKGDCEAVSPPPPAACLTLDAHCPIYLSVLQSTKNWIPDPVWKLLLWWGKMAASSKAFPVIMLLLTTPKDFLLRMTICSGSPGNDVTAEQKVSTLMLQVLNVYLEAVASPGWCGPFPRWQHPPFREPLPQRNGVPIPTLKTTGLPKISQNVVSSHKIHEKGGGGKGGSKNKKHEEYFKYLTTYQW